MSYQIKANYEQDYLLPPSIEDWIPKDHPTRFIREFAQTLNLKELGFKVETNEEGRPFYSADLLLKVWLYGYFQKIRSSRQLEKHCKENVSLIWLTGMNYPDHNTIWRFWDNNKGSIKKIFKQSVQIASKLKLIGMVLHALDGTKIQAFSSNRGILKEKKLKELEKLIDESIRQMESEVEKNEKVEEGEYSLPKEIQDKKEMQKKIQEALKDLKEIDRENIHPKEKEARVMKSAGSHNLSYNAQAVVDDKHGILVGADVINDENDTQSLVPMIDEVKDTLSTVAEITLADSGYATAEQIAEADSKEYKVLLNLTEKSNISVSPRKDEPFHHSNFKYDESKDVFVCPMSKELKYKDREKYKNTKDYVRKYKCSSFKECSSRWECSKSKDGREVKLNPYYKAVQKQQEFQQIESNKEKLRRRKGLIEPVFGIIKQAHNFRRFTVKGLKNTKVQWSLICTTINLKRMYGLWLDGKIKLT